MRHLATLLLLLLSIASFAGVFVYEGVYQGRDLYVKNPFASDGVGFCVFEVKVNGEVTTDEVNSSAFAIDLSLFDFNMGDPVEIVIRTKEDCEPRVINPKDILPRSTFELASMNLEADGSLSFATRNESGELPFVVEHFKWNKWTVVAGVEGKGAHEGENQYRVDVPLHSGENTFRIRQDGPEGSRISERQSMNSTQPAISIVDEKVFDTLKFSEQTAYEVFDPYGVLKAKGVGDSVDARSWKKGTYYVNFDNRFGALINKR